MIDRHKIRHIVVLGLLSLLPGAVNGQTEAAPEVTEEMLKKSHFLDDNFSPPPEYRDRIDSMVRKWQTDQYQKILDLIKNRKLSPQDAIKDPSFLNGLRADPAIPDSVKKLIDKYTDPQHTPDLSSKELDELRSLANIPHPERNASETKGTEKNDVRPPTETKSEPPGRESAVGNALGKLGIGSGQTKAGENEYAKRIMDWVNRSPSMRRALRELGRHVGEEDPRWGRLSAGIDSAKERWSRWSKEFDLDRLLSKKSFSWLTDMLPASTPRLGWPDRGTSGADGGEQGVSSSSSWVLILLAILLVVAVTALVLGWRPVIRARQLLTRRGREHLDLGVWPVNGTRALTRGEIVLAFEHLSLLNFGPEARTWNHREIEQHLAGTTTLKRPDSSRTSVRRWKSEQTFPVSDPLHPFLVGELTSLYEQARYAPPGDVLPQAALENARRDLCVLAGVTA